MLDSLKKNAFLDTETFDKFLTRRGAKGKRTMFLNKPTQADARDLMKEYRQQADDLAQRKINEKVKNLESQKEEAINIAE